jgi:hypothetical protein
MPDFRNISIMGSKEHEQLIFETLHYRPPAGRRFIANEPGLKLIASDPSFLSPIKAALLEASQGDTARLYGLGYVVGAFLVLGTKHAPETLVPFIVSLPRVLQREIVAAVPVFFQKNKRTGSYNFSTAPAQELIEFIRRLSFSGDPDLQKVAQRVLKLI